MTSEEFTVRARQIVPDSRGCWVWPHTDRRGGKVEFEGRPRGAHQVSFMSFVGAIAEGLQVCHSCDVPACVNPSHLFLGTQKDNMQDMARKGRQKKKLSDDAVRAIRAMSGSLSKIGRCFGIHKTTVMRVRNGQYFPFVQ